MGGGLQPGRLLPLTRPFTHVVGQAEVPGKVTSTERIPEGAGQFRRPPEMVGQAMPVTLIVRAVRPQLAAHIPPYPESV
jgi:hypothetical protein